MTISNSLDPEAKSLIERAVTIIKRRKEDGDDLSDLYKEAASNGFDKAEFKDAAAILAGEDDAVKKARAKKERSANVELILAAFGVEL